MASNGMFSEQTSYLEQSSSTERNSAFSCSRNSPHLITVRLHCRVHSSCYGPQPEPDTSNSHFPSHSPNIQFNVIRPSSKWSLLFKHSNQNSIRISHHPAYSLHARPISSSLTWHPNSIFCDDYKLWSFSHKALYNNIGELVPPRDK
jgi:hypothetical protein